MERMISGYYYLHSVSNELIFKRFRPEDDSPFVTRIWEVDPTDRAGMWILLIEAVALGADPNQIRYLSERWKADEEDLKIFLSRYPEPENELQKKGLRKFIRTIFEKDPIKWFISLKKNRERRGDANQHHN